MDHLSFICDLLHHKWLDSREKYHCQNRCVVFLVCPVTADTGVKKPASLERVEKLTKKTVDFHLLDVMDKQALTKVFKQVIVCTTRGWLWIILSSFDSKLSVAVSYLCYQYFNLISHLSCI